jgi:hypothetical protein
VDILPNAVGTILSERGGNQFCKSLQKRFGILALSSLSAPFRICKLLIKLTDGETDPISGHHLESISYRLSIISPPNLEALPFYGNYFSFNYLLGLDY